MITNIKISSNEKFCLICYLYLPTNVVFQINFLPVRNDQSAAEVLDIARDLDPGLAAAQRDVILALAKASYGCMPPLCGVVGGLAAQEVLKAVTGKYTPLDQWVSLCGKLITRSVWSNATKLWCLNQAFCLVSYCKQTYRHLETPATFPCKYERM